MFDPTATSLKLTHEWHQWTRQRQRSHTHLDGPHNPTDIITPGRVSAGLFPISNLNESHPHPLKAHRRAHTHTHHGLERQLPLMTTQWKISEPQKQRHLVELGNLYISSDQSLDNNNYYLCSGFIYHIAVFKWMLHAKFRRMYLTLLNSYCSAKKVFNGCIMYDVENNKCQTQTFCSVLMVWFSRQQILSLLLVGLFKDSHQQKLLKISALSFSILYVAKRKMHL